MNLCITWNCLNDKTTMGLCDKMLSHYRDSYGRDLGYRDENSRKTVIEYETDTGRTKRIQTSGAWFTYYYLAGTDLKSRLQYGGSGSAYYTYEPNRDLLTQVQNYINGGVISQYDYVNDAIGRRTEISRSGSRMTESRTDAYGYNDRNELVSGTKSGGSQSPATEYEYSYDDIGNRLSSLDLGTNRTYEANNLNQYTSISNAVGETFIPQYDLDMRPRQWRRVARRSEATEPRSGRKRPRNQTLVRTATGDWTVAYNAENRPVSWTCGTTNIVMLFDRMGRRVEYVETVTDGSGESTVTTTNRHHRFVYDGYLCVQRLNARSGNAIELSFAWDPTEPVATRPLVLQRQGGWNFFYTHDGNKNVSDVVSFQQARGVPAHYEYAPFGAVTAATTNTAFTAFNVAETNPYRFSSEYADDTLGLVYYNYRHYNPMDGRWCNFDECGFNLYDFCKNSPIKSLDWLGRLSLPPEPFFDDHSSRKKDLISAFVGVVKYPLLKVGSDSFFYRVSFVARFTPPRKVQEERIQPPSISKIIFGDSSTSLGGEEGMYEPNKYEGDIAAEAWGDPSVSEGPRTNGIRGERTFTYENKDFQFGYVVYRSNKGRPFQKIDMNQYMYTHWRVGSLRTLLPALDLSTSGHMSWCDIVVIRYGDRGIEPRNIVYKGAGVK